MICQFCDFEKGKLPRSHVIPEFLMKYAYDTDDQNHRGLVVRAQGVDLDMTGNLQQKRRRGDDVDDNLMCQDCEKLFNDQWERPVAKVLLDGDGLNVAQHQNYDLGNRSWVYHETVEGFNYPVVKLFILSVLWRLSVSKIGLAKRVQLGPHESRIHARLRKNDPGPDTEYLINLTKIRYQGVPFGYVEAYNTKIENHSCVFFFGGGYRVVTFISNHGLHSRNGFFQDVYSKRLKEDGSAVVMISEATELKALVDLVGKVKLPSNYSNFLSNRKP